MQLSKKKIDRARLLYNHRNSLSFKKYIVINELKDYGISVDANSDIDTQTLNKIYACVIERVVNKYGMW